MTWWVRLKNIIRRDPDGLYSVRIPFTRFRTVALHDPISVVMTAITGIYYFTVAGVAITWGQIFTGILIGASLWSSFAMKSGAKSRTQGRNGHLVNTKSQSEPIPILYGDSRCGGNWVFWGASGTGNKYFWVVVGWGEGEIEGYQKDIERQPEYLYPEIDSTPGLNDLVADGIFTGATFAHIQVKITTVGATDKFKYRVKDGDYLSSGDAWSAETDITADWQDLSLGIRIKFSAKTGHDIGTALKYWNFYAGDGIWVGPRLIYNFEHFGPAGKDLITHTFYGGSATQTVDATLQAAFPDWNDPMRNTAYSIFKLEFNENAFSQLPEFQLSYKGRKVRDVRTAGYPNVAYAYSRNPTLCIADFVTTRRFGLGLLPSLLDSTTWQSNATWCDPDVATNGGSTYTCIANHTSAAGSEPGVGADWRLYWELRGTGGDAWALSTDYVAGFQFDGGIFEQRAFLDNYEDMLLNFNSFTIFSGGVYKLKAYTNDAAVMTLTDADIEVNEDSFRIITPGMQEISNSYRCVFPDRSKGFTSNEGVSQDLTVIATDGDVIESEMMLIGTGGLYQAQAIAQFHRIKNSFGNQFIIKGFPRTFALECGDMVNITHEFPNWTAKKLRLYDMGIPQDGLVDLILHDEDGTTYGDPPTVTLPYENNNPPPVPPGPDIPVNPPFPDGHVITTGTYIDYDNTTGQGSGFWRAWMEVDFDDDSNAYRYWLECYQDGTAAEWALQFMSQYDYTTQVPVSKIKATGLNLNTKYWFRVGIEYRNRNIVWDDVWWDYTTPGNTVNDVTGLKAWQSGTYSIDVVWDKQTVPSDLAYIYWSVVDVWDSTWSGIRATNGQYQIILNQESAVKYYIWVQATDGAGNKVSGEPARTQCFYNPMMSIPPSPYPNNPDYPSGTIFVMPASSYHRVDPCDSEYNWVTYFQGVTGFFQVTDGGATYTDKTIEANESTENDFDIIPSTSPAAGDGCCFMFWTNKMHTFVLHVGTAMVGTPTYKWQYFNGTDYTDSGDWADLSGGVGKSLSDGTAGFTSLDPQYIKFFPQSDWASTTIGGKTGYPIRVVYQSGAITTKPLGTQAYGPVFGLEFDGDDYQAGAGSIKATFPASGYANQLVWTWDLDEFQKGYGPVCKFSHTTKSGVTKTYLYWATKSANNGGQLVLHWQDGLGTDGTYGELVVGRVNPIASDMVYDSTTGYLYVLHWPVQGNPFPPCVIKPQITRIVPGTVQYQTLTPDYEADILSNYHEHAQLALYDKYLYLSMPDPTVLVGVSKMRIIEIDLTTFTVSRTATANASAGAASVTGNIAVDPDGTNLYVENEGSIEKWTRATLAYSTKDTTGYYSTLYGTLKADSSYLYCVTQSGDAYRISKANLDTATTLSPPASRTFIGKLEIDATYCYLSLDGAAGGELYRTTVAAFNSGAAATCVLSDMADPYAITVDATYIYTIRNVQTSFWKIARVLVSDFATIVYYTGAALDLSGDNHLTLRLKASVNCTVKCWFGEAAIAEQGYQVDLRAGVWERIRWRVDSIAAEDRDAVKYFGIEAISCTAGQTLNIDPIEGWDYLSAKITGFDGALSELVQRPSSETSGQVLISQGEDLPLTWGNIALKSEEFTANGYFTVPVGVTDVWVTALGAGAGGGGGRNNNATYGGGGGGAGQLIYRKTIVVVPGEQLTITVGAGGTGGANSATGNDGTAGNDTTVKRDATALVTAGGGYPGLKGNTGTGGRGGGVSAYAGSGGAAGATGSSGSTGASSPYSHGGAGGAGGSSTSGGGIGGYSPLYTGGVPGSGAGGGGSGAGGFRGTGAAGGDGAGANDGADAAVNTGAGGGGGGSNASGNGGSGGDGGSGYVLIEYIG